MDIMQIREKIIRQWFEMWLRQKDTGIENIFTENALYIESWSPQYIGRNKIKHWFDEWNNRGKVIVWDIKQFFHKDNQTVVEWFFKNEMNNGKEECFDGITLIEWTDDNKIIRLKEFGIISLNKRNEKCAVFKEIGAVKNLTVDNAKINYTPDDTGDYYVGIIAGSAQVLENCKVSGEITITHTGTYGATSYIGGAVGRMRSALGLDEYKVIDSYSDVKIRYYSVNKTSRSLYVGGLFGSDEESSNLDHKIEFSGCGANVDIELLGVSTVLVGGLIGYMTGDITNSYATGKIVVDGDGSTASNTVISIGGVVSNVNNGSITSCYAAMNLTAKGDVQNVYIGGIARSAAGKKEQELKNCLFVGNIAITAGEDKLAMSNSLAVGLLPLYTVNNCYHSDNLVAPVVTEKTIAVAEATIKTAAWQQETLKFDPDVWNIEDGKYPTLK